MATVAAKRDPREPTPLVLMNPELRVRQLRYAANIEASPMVPLQRYFEVLVDLSSMGLDYLKDMKLERAYIIFKRIEFFVHHRLKDVHSYAKEFKSTAKDNIVARLPMIMYVAQQIIIDFIMPVYQRQAAYFRYEELQRRLAILNPDAWTSILPEAKRREAEFYAEAERISNRFGVDLVSLLPDQVTPDGNHPSNYPPRTHMAKPAGDDVLGQTALSMAINTMNTTAQGLRISIDQPVETLVTNINQMMNEALTNFFNARYAQWAARTGQKTVPNPPNQVTMPYRAGTAQFEERPRSPKATYMSYITQQIPSPQVDRAAQQQRNPYEYNPTYPIETYIGLLKRVFETNSVESTGFRIEQVMLDSTRDSPSTAAFMMYLRPINGGASTATSEIRPDVDPGPPRRNPPTEPLPTAPKSAEKLGVWSKVGKGKEDLGSIGVLSELADSSELLDRVPPLPDAPGPSNVAGPSHLTTRPLTHMPPPLLPGPIFGGEEGSKRTRLVDTKSKSKSTDSEIDVVKIDDDDEETNVSMASSSSTSSRKRPRPDDDDAPSSSLGQQPFKRIY